MSRLENVLRFESLRAELHAAADEMAIRLARSSISPVIRDFLDFSTALCLADGRVVAQGFSLPLHLGAIPRAMQAVLASDLTFEPGDLVVLNDPYRGGMHLPDIFMVDPVFADGDLIGFAVAVAHHADIGGRVPGGSGADSKEIFEEGLRLPPVKLRRHWTWAEDLQVVIDANVRMPEATHGDLDAQAAACAAGRDAFALLSGRHGTGQVLALCEELIDYSDRALAAEIEGWPDGKYEFEDYEDHDGLTDRRVPIRVTVTVAGSSIRFDFAGTSEQVRGAINCTLSYTESACYAAVRALCAGDVPVNAGFTRRIEVRAPTRSLVNVAFPGAVAARGVIGYRIIEAVFGALAGPLANALPAAGDGGTSGIRLGGYTEDGRRFQYNDIVCGAWGARPGLDGLDGSAGIAANLANRSIEVAEREDPVAVLEYGFVPDSEGAGQYRGGLAIRRAVQLLAPAATLAIRTHRRVTPPYGLAGGLPGSTSATYLIRDGKRTLLPAKAVVEMRRGDVVEHTTASGGGHGDPRKRDPALIDKDVADGKISPARAKAAYGRDVGGNTKAMNPSQPAAPQPS
jgi:N-methylhydantoinase B